MKNYPLPLGFRRNSTSIANERADMNSVVSPELESRPIARSPAGPPGVTPPISAFDLYSSSKRSRPLLQWSASIEQKLRDHVGELARNRIHGIVLLTVEHNQTAIGQGFEQRAYGLLQLRRRGVATSEQ